MDELGKYRCLLAVDGPGSKLCIVGTRKLRLVREKRLSVRLYSCRPSLARRKLRIKRRMRIDCIQGQQIFVACRRLELKKQGVNAACTMQSEEPYGCIDRVVCCSSDERQLSFTSEASHPDALCLVLGYDRV